MNEEKLHVRVTVATDRDLGEIINLEDRDAVRLANVGQLLLDGVLAGLEVDVAVCRIRMGKELPVAINERQIKRRRSQKTHTLGRTGHDKSP